MTPSDLCNYIIETQLAYEGRSSKVLTQTTTQLRLTPYNDQSAALGVFIEKRGNTTYFQHGAGNEGFRGMYYGSLEGGRGVAVFVNSDNGTILNELINAVAEAYNWADFYTAEVKTEVKIPEDVFKKYEGIYVFENSYAIVLQKQDGYYYLADGVYSKMHFTNEKEFFNEEFSSEKTFVFDAEGKTSGFLRKVKNKEFPLAIKIVNADTLTRPGYWLNTVGWYLLENKQYDNAISFLNRGMKRPDSDLAAVGNLGHCYLFKGEYDKAINLYKEFLAEAKESNPSMQSMIVQDFEFFKSNGFDTDAMDKVMADLKLKIPEGYKTK